MSWDFRGASFDRSAFGPNAHVDARNSSSGGSTLKVELASLRGNLQAQPDSRDRDAAIAELDELNEELVKPEPDGKTVRSKWERVRARVALVLPAAAELATIASLINDVAGA